MAPDLRGFGYTDKPPTTDGYDSGINADDMAELMTKCGHETFFLHGEDRGADYAYALAAKYRDRVTKLSFCEMLISGFGLEESNAWTKANISAQYEQKGVWCWHLSFFYLPHIPEMLIAGHEREFWVSLPSSQIAFLPSLVYGAETPYIPLTPFPPLPRKCS